MINSSDETEFRIWKIDTFKIDDQFRNGKGIVGESPIDKVVSQNIQYRQENTQNHKEIFRAAHFLSDCWESFKFSNILGSIKNFNLIKVQPNKANKNIVNFIMIPGNSMYQNKKQYFKFALNTKFPNQSYVATKSWMDAGTDCTIMDLSIRGLTLK